MRVALALLLFGLALSGCTSVGGQSKTRTETVVQVQYQTVTTTPPPPPTYLKIISVKNTDSQGYEVRFQSYALNSNGDHVTSSYPIKSTRIGTGTTPLASDSYPKCDDRSEGINISLWTIGGVSEKKDEGYWPGIHCTGEARTYSLSVTPGPQMGFG